MKKHIMIFGLLTVLLITTLLAGCGGGGGGASTTTPGGATTSPGGATTSPGGATTSPVTTTTTVTTGDNLDEIIGQAAAFPTVRYDMITTVSGQMTMTVKYWMKNKKVRAEMPDTGVITLMDMDAHTMYMYTPATNTAIKIVYNTSQAPENPNQILDYTPNIVGTETIDGKVCTVIEYNYTQANVKTWIWNDKGYPVRMESTSNGVTSIVEWKNFDFSDIADSMFELPEGVEVIDVGG
jgi:outer membrane lipoprotein-sorting protein